MTDFKMRMATKILSENLIHYIGGLENSVRDNEITKLQFNENIELEVMKEVAAEMLSNAYKRKNLESPISYLTMEAKHIKFGGKENIERIKSRACVIAIKTVDSEFIIGG